MSGVGKQQEWPGQSSKISRERVNPGQHWEQWARHVSVRKVHERDDTQSTIDKVKQEDKEEEEEKRGVAPRDSHRVEPQ